MVENVNSLNNVNIEENDVNIDNVDNVNMKREDAATAIDLSLSTNARPVVSNDLNNSALRRKIEPILVSATSHSHDAVTGYRFI